jgi:leucyl/phenylalanyl-tRNA---protein transferase
VELRDWHWFLTDRQNKRGLTHLKSSEDEFRFPDPRLCGAEGIVALGGSLHPLRLLSAYRHGIFPWPVRGLPTPWVCPAERAILRFENLYLSRSLKKMKKKAPFTFTTNQAFADVMQACGFVRRSDDVPNEPHQTWITPKMIHAYTELHKLGHAHSVEAWKGDRLVGGIYGVNTGGSFSAESMFYLEPYASKLAFLYLVEDLQKQGMKWVDIQMLTPHMAALGASEIPREKFLTLLSESLNPPQA